MNKYEVLDMITGLVIVAALIGTGFIVYEMRDIIFGIGYH